MIIKLKGKNLVKSNHSLRLESFVSMRILLVIVAMTMAMVRHTNARQGDAQIE